MVRHKPIPILINVNYRGPLILPSSLSLQLSLCWLSPINDFTRKVAADAANVALDLRFNVKQVINLHVYMQSVYRRLDLFAKKL